MTNHSSNRFGGGSQPVLRGSRGRRGIGILCLVVGLLASAVPAWAAEIVEVRVGRHPEFTRVVFELDRAAGYRIERADPSKDGAGLVVSLEATSIPRKVESGKSLIEQVSVEPMGARSVARVRLAKEGLRLKEMILTNPPRIVLDVLNEAEPAAVVAKAKPAATRAEPVAPEKQQPAPSSASASTQKRERAESPAREPVETAAAASGEGARSADSDASDSSDAMAWDEIEDEEFEVSRARARAEAEALAAGADAALEERGDDFFGDDPQDEQAARPKSSAVAAAEALAQMGEPEQRPGRAAPTQQVARPQQAPEPIVDPEARTETQPVPRPMVAKSKSSSSDEGGGFMTWALAGVGAILVVGGLFLARRRSAAAEPYEDAAEDSEGYIDDDDMAITTVDENPFGGLSDEAGQDDRSDLLGGPKEVTVPPMMLDDGDDTIVSVPDDEKEWESVAFDDSAEGQTVMEDMEVISRDQVNESLGGGMPSAMAAGIPEEFQQMMAEMSRRMEALESRCDELVDARDRLERQVAAQTEELRVQRAAIARTQRAVRNLGRPEGEEPEATEPALRDPSSPNA